MKTLQILSLVSAYHKVTLNKLELVRQTFPGCVPRCTSNLVLIDVEPGDVAASKLHNFPCRATHTATNVEDFHIALDADTGCQVVLVTGDGLREGLSVCEPAKMKGFTPSVFVKVRGKVIVSAIVKRDGLARRAAEDLTNLRRNHLLLGGYGCAEVVPKRRLELRPGGKVVDARMRMPGRCSVFS